MITLLQLKKEKMLALKEHDENKQNVLGIIIAAYQKAEIEMRSKGQEMSDADVVSLLNKVVKELEDEKTMYLNGNRAEEAAASQAQIDIVKTYLPAMMSKEEISSIISNLPDKSIKAIMIEFKTKYAGKADMSLVNQVAKEFQN